MIHRRPAPLDRRRFLISGSRSVVAPLVLPWVGANAVATSRGTPTGRLRVGYLSGSGRLADPARFVRDWQAAFVEGPPHERPDTDEAPTEVIAADALRHGDPTFAQRGVQLDIHGIHLPKPDGQTPGLRRCAIDLLFPGAAGSDTRPVLAWQLRTDGVPSCAPSTRCDIPLDEGGAIAIRVTWQSRHVDPGAADEEDGVRLAATGRDGLALRRGIYFVGIPPNGTLRSDDLTCYRFGAEGAPTGRLRLHRDSWLSPGHSPSDPYLVLSVDYGGSTHPSAPEGRGAHANG